MTSTRSHPPQRRHWLALACVAALQATLGLAPAAASGTTSATTTLPTGYTLQLLGNLPVGPGASVRSEVMGLNSRGEVAGRTYTSTAGQVLYTPTVWAADGTPSARPILQSSWQWANANALNDGGLAVGSLAAGGYSYTAVRWSADGELENLGARAGAYNSEARAINTVWQTVGGATRGSTQEAALWQADGSFVNLGHLEREGNVGLSSLATAINDSGSVLGTTRFQTADTQAWIWSPVSGRRALQQAAPGASTDIALALNGAGWAVGQTQASSSAPGHAVLWDAQGQLIDIQGSGFSSTWARGINDAGLVVGDGAQGGDLRAWVWSAGSGMVALDTLIPGLSDFRVLQAAGINAYGQIVGTGYDTAAGQSRAFVLTPITAVPEPAPAALLAAGLLVLACLRRARAQAVPAGHPLR